MTWISVTGNIMMEPWLSHFNSHLHIVVGATGDETNMMHASTCCLEKYHALCCYIDLICVNVGLDIV